jgi:mannosyltransferase OCH1-like enzyme
MWKWLCLSLVLMTAAVLYTLLVFKSLGSFSPALSGSPSSEVPKIIHLIYFPWDREQRLKPDPNDFDQTYHRELAGSYPDFEVMMWTIPKIRKFLSSNYPGVWEASIRAAVRPTQLVDLYRWLVVDHFGGIYLQYHSKLHTHPKLLFPSEGYQLRLFTENVWFSWLIRIVPPLLFPIRNSQPEEELRIMNQVFAATPGHPFVREVWRSIFIRMHEMKPREDYDILYIGANAYISEVYDKMGKNDSTIQLANWTQTRNLLQVSSFGSWCGNWHIQHHNWANGFDKSPSPEISAQPSYRDAAVSSNRVAK